MPAEYYEWINTLSIRDTYAVFAAVGGAIVFAALLGLERFIPDLPRLRVYVPPWVWLAGIVVFGASLRVCLLGQQSLWYDETFSALAAERPFWDVVSTAAHDYHPPAYFILLWGGSRSWWFLSGLSSLFPYLDYDTTGHVVRGTLPLEMAMKQLPYLVNPTRPPEWWLRLPSALFGITNVGLTYHVARRLRPNKEAITAAALMAFMPFQIAYSQEARMYQMMLFGALLALAGYLGRRWWLVVLAGALLLYTQSMSVVFLAALGLASLLFDRSRLRPLFLSGLAVAALHLPWLLYGLAGQLERMGGGHYWIPQITPGSFAYLWHVLLWHSASPNAIIFPGMIVSMVLVAAAVYAAVRQRLHFIFGLMIGPPLLAVLPSLLVSPVILPRTFITVTPAFYMLIAAALWSRKAWSRSLLAGLVGVMVLVSLVGYYTDPRLQKWPNREWAADLIAARYQPGDAVLYLPQSLPFWWYLPQRIPQYFLPQNEGALNAGFNLTNQAATALGLATAGPDDLRGYDRVFVVYGRSPATGQYQTNAFESIRADHRVIREDVFAQDGNHLYAAVILFDWSSP